MKQLLYAMLVTFALLLAGCANAGKDQTVNANTLVTLDGSASTPSVKGKITKYRWRQIKGKKVKLSNKHAVSPTFMAPDVNKKTKLVFLLTTTETGGVHSPFKSRDRVTITVIPSDDATDTTPPVITLNGSPTVTLNVGDTYVEQGATATDETDGDVDVTISGSVDTSTAGTYTITYTATDTAGNRASKTRTVKVKALPLGTLTGSVFEDTNANGVQDPGEPDANGISLQVTDSHGFVHAVETANGYYILELPIGMATITLLTDSLPENATLTTGYSPVNVMIQEGSNFGEVYGYYVPAPDTTPPVITLNGSPTVTLTVGDTYIEQGATATDETDGDVDVTISGSVDTSIAGTYTITYTATDSAGNRASETRTVIVKKDEDQGNALQIQGQITDTNGTAISNATIQIGNKTTLSDTNGSYSIGGIPLTERTVVNVTHPDYLKNSRVLVDVNGTVTLDIKLGAPKATQTFDSSEGATVSSSDGASVELPAGGYIDANGSAYTGDVIVKMAYYPITTLSGRAAFPGTFEGKDGNETFPIQSYGFMNVELTDPQGNALNLDGNNTATLTYPVDNSIDYTPATVPLWYYDEALGYWVQEGEAVRSGNYTHYTGTVTHFTSWNLDAPGPKAKLKGCVEDINGNRVANAEVYFRTVNWDSYGVPTDTNGEISVINILAEEYLTFAAIASIGETIYYGEYPSAIYLNDGEERVLSDCVVLKDIQGTLPNTITVTGKIFDTFNHQPLANHAYYIYAGSDRNTPVVSGTTNSDGAFSITFNTVDAIMYFIDVDRSNMGYFLYEKFILQPYKNTYDLGVLRAGVPM